MIRRCFVVVITFLVVVGTTAVSANDWKNAELQRDERYNARESVRSIGRRWVEVPRCKQTNEPCSGFPRCCDKLRCFWEDGYNPLQSGVCVTCFNRNQRCQTDAQCCESLVCQKSSRYQVDGICDAKRIDGGDCHDDDQCQSSYCLMTWVQVIKGQGGRCTPRS